MPAPQSAAPVPAEAHVVVPLGTTFQPCDLSSATAAVGLYGYVGVVALAGAYGEVGADGVGP